MLSNGVSSFQTFSIHRELQVCIRLRPDLWDRRSLTCSSCGCVCRCPIVAMTCRRNHKNMSLSTVPSSVQKSRDIPYLVPPPQKTNCATYTHHAQQALARPHASVSCVQQMKLYTVLGATCIAWTVAVPRALGLHASLCNSLTAAAGPADGTQIRVTYSSDILKRKVCPATTVLDTTKDKHYLQVKVRYMIQKCHQEASSAVTTVI